MTFDPVRPRWDQRRLGVVKPKKEASMSTTPHQVVARIMSWPVATIDHEATLQEAAESLADDNVGVLLVLRDRAVAGLLSERDVVLPVAAGTNLTHLHVGEVMAGELVTVTPGDTVLAAARLMVEADVRHLPVLDGGLIAGMLSIRDVVPALVDAADDGEVVVVPSGARIVVRES
jgi:CBS domain-containing protein